MIIFTDANSAKAFHHTMAFSLSAMENGPHPEKHAVFLRMVKDAMAPDRVVYLFHGDSDTKKGGVPAYFDWVWYDRAVKDEKYVDFVHEFPTTHLPLSPLRENTRRMNGGWMNHGTEVEPMWGSHS